LPPGAVSGDNIQFVRADLYIESVLAKCETLKKSGIWAPEPQLRPTAWLENFPEGQERLLAAILLDNLVFYSDRALDRMLRAAYYHLEDDVLLGQVRCEGHPRAFLDSMVFTPIEGEIPRPADSGRTVCRKLRGILELGDQRFVDPAKALQEAQARRPIVFVDDFLGSGQQLLQTWNRRYSGVEPKSFADAYRLQTFPVFCLAPVATETAIRNLTSQGVPVDIRPTHILDDGYSVQRMECPVLTPPIADFANVMHSFLERHSRSLTLEPFLEGGDCPLYGFHELGLLYGSEFAVPDSTIPLVWAPGPGQWIRLVKVP
jgi:hypothetical protein